MITKLLACPVGIKENWIWNGWPKRIKQLYSQNEFEQTFEFFPKALEWFLFQGLFSFKLCSKYGFLCVSSFTPPESQLSPTAFEAPSPSTKLLILERNI